VLAILPNIPGFLGQIKAINVSAGWITFYNYAWFTGFFFALILYYIFMRLFNAQEQKK
jgi:cytosine/uracil/thiamine/allantoin permease